jgi:hypothetical protein
MASSSEHRCGFSSGLQKVTAMAGLLVKGLATMWENLKEITSVLTMEY